MKKWFFRKTPFTVKTDIYHKLDGTIMAVAAASKIHDPIDLLPPDIETYTCVGTAKLHPDDEYDDRYGVRLASNRARRRFYTHIAHGINKRLEEIDQYLLIIHNKIKKLDDEAEQLALEQINFKEPPEEDE